MSGAQMVGRPLPSLGHGEGPRVPAGCPLRRTMRYRACIKCPANCRLSRNPVKGPPEMWVIDPDEIARPEIFDASGVEWGHARPLFRSC